MKKPLVILLHGILRSKYSMYYLSAKLRKQGFETYLFGYRSLTFDIDAHADQLKKEITDRFGHDRELNFVTHSLGSIIVRRFCAKYHANYKLGKVVMLGPPNQGSGLAKKLARISIIAKIMGPSFKQLCDLKIENSSDKIQISILAGRKKIPFLSVESDGIVSIEETKLEGAKLHLIFNGLHSFLMYNKPVINQTLEILSRLKAESNSSACKS